MKIVKNIKYNKKNLISFFLVCFLFLGVLSLVDNVLALNNCSTGYKVDSGQNKKVDCHGVCKNVKNNNSSDIFVPTRTSNEWSAFRSNASNVSLSSCITYSWEKWDWKNPNIECVAPKVCKIISDKEGTKTKQCYQSCDGTETRDVWCERSDGVEVSDSYCVGNKPNSDQSCNKCGNSGSDTYYHYYRDYLEEGDKTIWD